MAETLTAQLALELGGFTAGLQNAIQAFQQFTHNLANQVQQLQQPFAQIKTFVEDTAKAKVKTEKDASDAVLALQRSFFQTTLGLAKEHEQARAALLKEQAALEALIAKGNTEQIRATLAAQATLRKENAVAEAALLKEQAVQEKATHDAVLALQRNFFQTTLGLAKEHEQARAALLKEQAVQEKATHDAVLALQRNFFAVTLGLAKEREQVNQSTNKALADQERQLQRDREAAVRQQIQLQTRADLDRIQERKRAETELQREINRLHAEETRQLAAERRAQQAIDEQYFADQRRLRNNQLRAELTNVRAGSPTPGPQPGAVPGGNQLPFALGELQNYIQLLRQAEIAQNTSSLSLTSLLGTFGGLSKFLTGAGILLGLQQMAQFLKEIGTQSVNLAVQFQALEATFRGTTGSFAASRETLGFLRGEARRLGVDFFTLGGTFKNLDAASRAAGLSAKDTREVFVSFSEASRALGLSSDSLQHILVAVEQIISKGKVSAEELRRQMGNFLPGSFNIAAAAIGKTTSELDDMLKKGALVSSEFILPFAREVRRTFADAVPAATQTAAASFARFFNETKELGVAFGNSILAFLKPILDTATQLIEKANKARQLREDLANEGLRDTREPAPAAGKAAEELKQLFDRVQFIKNTIRELRNPNVLTQISGVLLGADTEKEILSLTEELKALEKVYNTLNEKVRATGGGLSDDIEIEVAKTPFAQNIKEIQEITKQMREDLEAIDVGIKHFGGQTDLERAKNQFREIDRAVNDINESIAKTPGLRKVIPPAIQKEIDAVKDLLLTTKANVKQFEEREKAAKELEQELEKDDKNRRDRIHEFVKEQEKATQEEIDDAERAFDTINKLRKQFSDEQLAIEKELTQLVAKETRTRSDDLRAQLELDTEAYKKRGATPEQIERLTQASLRQIRRVETEDLARELKQQEALIREQEKPWRELGNRIENILAGTFERILNGTQSIFDGIKDAFIKLLARLAAEAATAQIVVGIRSVLGGSLGTGAASVTASLLNTTVGGQEGGGFTPGSGGEGGGINGQQLLGLGSNVASIYGGLTGKSATGGLLNLLGGSSFLNTPLFGTGVGFAGGAGTGSVASLGATAPTGFYATGTAGSAVPAGVSSVPITGSTILGAAGLGVGVGLLSSQLLSLFGLKGTGNAVLSGALGGAAAGTVILPGIGTAIGAGVGALGGYIASLFGGGKRKPQIDIRSVTGGSVGYDEVLGGLTHDPFRITDAPFRDIGDILPNVGRAPGQTTYANFLGLIDDQLNQLFGGVIEGFRSLQPQAQKALIGPLSEIGEQIRQDVERTKFKGQDALDQLQEYFSTDLPDLVTNLLRPITEGLQKVDPYIREFNTAISAAQERIAEIEALQAQSTISIQTQLANIRKDDFTPFEQLVERLQILDRSRAQLGTLDPLQALGTGKIIQGLVDEIAQLTATLKGQVTQARASVGQQLLSLTESRLSPEALRQKRLEQLTAAQASLATATPQQLLELAPVIQGLVQELLQLDATLAGTTTDFSQLQASIKDQVEQIQDSQLSSFDLLIRKQRQLATALEGLTEATGISQGALIGQAQELVGGIQGITTELLQQRDQLASSLEQQIRALEEGLFTPAQLYVKRQGELAARQAEFATASPSRRVELIPIIQGLAQDLFSLGRGEDVLGQDPQLVRQTQADLLELLRGLQNENTKIFQGAETQKNQLLSILEKLKIDLAQPGSGGILESVLKELQDRLGLTEESLGSIPDILIDALNQVQGSNDTAYGSFTTLLKDQIVIAQQQIEVLINSLGNLSSIDAVVQSSREILGQVNSVIASTQEQDAIQNQLQIELLAGSYVSLQGIQDLAGQQVGLLGSISQNLTGVGGGGGFTGGHADDGGGEGGFARGSNYIPYNMVAFLHQGEAVIPRHRNTGAGSGMNINITVTGGGDRQTADAVAERVVQYIEQRSGRLGATRIQTKKG